MGVVETVQLVVVVVAVTGVAILKLELLLALKAIVAAEGRLINNTGKMG